MTPLLWAVVYTLLPAGPPAPAGYVRCCCTRCQGRHMTIAAYLTHSGATP